MTVWAADALALFLVGVGACLLPWVMMRALLPTLEAAGVGAVDNYRGKRVVYGLGLVWVAWAIGLQLLALLDIVAAGLGVTDFETQAVSGLPLDSLPYTLVLGALALGMLDDVYGTGRDRGFGGHLSALAHGRLTTGGLKVLGIGLLAAASVVPDVSQQGAELYAAIGVWVLQVLGIALTANFVNLMDLRPGRALKAFGLLSIASCVVVGVSGDWVLGALLAVLLLGPAAAVWGADLGERGMLGDGGANAAGALVGWLIVNIATSWWVLGVYVGVVLAANIASERVSFSRVIEGNALLRWLDGIGRLQNAASMEGGSSEPDERSDGQDG